MQGLVSRGRLGTVRFQIGHRTSHKGHTCSDWAASGSGRVPRKQPFATGLKGGVFATNEEIAAAEKINSSYLGRVLRLALLAPDIVETILDGRQRSAMALAVLVRLFVLEWAASTASAATSMSDLTLPSSFKPHPFSCPS